MRISLLLEAPHPRPWSAGGDGRRLRALVDVAVRAEELGVSRVWVPERHFQEELHHAGPPEILLGAIAARTRRLGLGLGPLGAHPRIQHPARLASAVAALDAYSSGRVAVAFAEPRAAIELGPFHIARAGTRQAADRTIERVARLLAEEPFSGEEPRADDVLPVRQLVPRPHQRPHPPLWRACDRPEDVRTAALGGLGALVRTLLEPDEAAEWAAEHAAVQRSAGCQPLGAAIETGVAVCLPVHVAADAVTALAEGLDGVHLHRHLTDHHERFGAHRPGRTRVLDDFERRRRETGLDPAPVLARPDGPLAVRIGGSLRGAVGDPEQVAELLARYRDAGVSEVVLVPPLGLVPGAVLARSLTLLGSVLPAFWDDEDDLVEAEDPALRAALRRRRPVPPQPETVVLPREDGALDEAPPPQLGVGTVSGTVGGADGRSGAATGGGRAGGQAFGALVDRGSPRLLRRTVASPPALRVLFAGMARALRPAGRSGELRGELQFDLVDDDGRVRSWTVEAGPLRVAARSGAAREPLLTLRMSPQDLLRLVAGRIDAGAALLDGRLDLEGDLALAVRMGDLFRR